MACTGSNKQRMDVEQAVQTAAPSEKRGGWITLPFLLGNMMGMSVAIFGVTSNFMVYLIKQFNVDGIDAAQINNIVNGCINLAPIAGAVLSDSSLGCFVVVVASSFLSLLGMVLFTLTAAVGSLRPPTCPPGGADACKPPSAGQNAVLYLAVALGCAGTGGTRFNLATMGANQFDTPRDQNVFFNWYFFVMYIAAIIGSTAVVYVQDNVSWSWGFGICTAANAASVIILLLGAGYYRVATPEGSPYVGLARVLVAATRKWRVAASEEATEVEYYCGSAGGDKRKIPTGSFRLLNRAALKSTGDINADGSLARPWRLCTVDQVEDLKAVVRILPLWLSSIFLSVSIGIVLSLAVLQALSLDRRLGPHFTVPAGTLSVVALVAAAVTLPALDRCLYPAWRRLVGRSLTPLQRLGVGHVVNTAAMAAAALVERRRLAAARSLHGLEHQPGALVPMSVLWLVPPLAMVGLGESFHFPGQVALYYQVFPETLRSSATGLVGLVIAVGFYVSTAVVDLVRRVTDWLPADINAGRLDKVCWMLAAVGVINFGFYLLCACSYRYQAVVEPDRGSSKETHELISSAMDTSTGHGRRE